MRKLAIALSKGGVGKTTTAINLAHGLARSGYRVLLVDTDTQGQVAESLGQAPSAGLAEVMAEEVRPEDAVFQARESLWMLAGGRKLAGIKQVIARKEFGGEQVFSKALDSLDGQYDYVILDTAPGWDTLTINVLFYAQEVLAPIALEVLAVKGIVRFERRLADIQEYHQDTEFKYVLPTFMDRRVKKSEEILRLLVNHYGQRLCQPIRYNVRLSEAPGYGQTIFEYAPTSPGAEDYQTLTERIESG